MYLTVKSCVVTNGQQSDFFSVSTGVRQGENLSPVLFAIYINDLESSLGSKACQEVPIGKYQELNTMLRLMILLYADDTAVLSNSPQGLQRCLDALAVYCDKWKLTVNATKTQVVIFSKRRTQGNMFTYMGRRLEQVESFKYLGVKFNWNGKFTECKKHLRDQGLRAMYAIINKGRKLQLPLDIMLHLFDSTVVPILLYSCEVWGESDCEIIERLHRQFCKHILYLKDSTPNCMIYGETGRFPLALTVKQRTVKYWAKIITNTNAESLVVKTYNILFRLYSEGEYLSPWLEGVKNILCENGFGNIWYNQAFPSIEWLSEALKTRLQDQFKQEWNGSVQTMPKCATYKLFKGDWGQPKYLLILPRQLRIPLSKFRTSNHKLAIERGRYNNIVRHERKCNLCTENKLGDEFHFLLECPSLNELRQKYLPSIVQSPRNIISLTKLMTDEKKKTLYKLSQFVREGLNIVH